MIALVTSIQPIPSLRRIASGDALEDAELVRRVLDGDRWAEEALYRRYIRRVAGTALRLLGDRAEAEDVAQDAFVQAFADLPDLREASAFGSWLLRITVRKVHRRFRKRRLLSWVGVSSEGDSPLEAMAGPGVSPDEAAELHLLDRVLAKLSPADRTAWSLRHIEGLKLDEAAYATECSLATVKRRIARAQAMIAKHTGIEL